MTPILHVHGHVVTRTIEALQDAGRRGAEGVVLWLGRRSDGGVTEVLEAHVPLYESGSHRFWIPANAMADLMAHLRDTGTHLAAQIHSHPERAFHSHADDEWAIVRHRGALSLVVPDFAGRTTSSTFLADVAAFALSAENKWIEVRQDELVGVIKVL